MSKVKMNSPSSNIILTRYLYLKDEVVLHLISDILDKKESAIYWACELFHSGFKVELFEMIWKIYYNFFASLNPSYESYLQKKEIIIFNGSETKHIASIVKDLILRDYNMDVLLLKTYNDVFEMNEKENLEKWIENEDFVSISIYICNQKSETSLDIYKKAIDIFGKRMNVYKSKWLNDYEKRIDANTNVDEHTILIAKIMGLFMKSKRKEKKKYTLLDKEDVAHLENGAYLNMRAWNVLRHARIPRNRGECFAFFARSGKYIISEKVFKEIIPNKWQWLYHASFSPIWLERIQQHMGYVDYENKNVCFADTDEELEEAFCKYYDYEPDEQPLFVFKNEKEDDDDLVEAFGKMAITVENFYKKYNVHGIVSVEEDVCNCPANF